MLITRDFTQENGVNYHKIFSHVAKYVTIHMVCALAAIFSYNISLCIFIKGHLHKTINWL